MHSLKKRFILLLLSILVFPISIAAQDFKKDLDQMHQYYQGQAQFHTQMKIDVFKENGSSSPFMAYSAFVSKNGGQYYYKLNDTEMYMGKDKLIMVYGAQKQIIYRDISKQESAQIGKNLYTSSLDSTISNYDSVRYSGLIGADKHYTIFCSNKFINKIELMTNFESGKIEKIIYHYNQKVSKDIGKVVIAFKEPEGTVKLVQDYKEEDFVIRRDKKLYPSSNYSNYHISIVSNEN